MAYAPNEIGINGTAVRAVIQAKIDLINQLMQDPLFADNLQNNLVSQADSDAGKKKFIFKFPGQLNAAEKTTVEDGWVSAGWDSAVAANNDQNSHDDVDNNVWTFTLIFNG